MEQSTRLLDPRLLALATKTVLQKHRHHLKQIMETPDPETTRHLARQILAQAEVFQLMTDRIVRDLHPGGNR